MTLEFIYQDFDPVVEVKKHVPEQQECTKNLKLPVRNLKPEIKQLLQVNRVRNRWTIQDLAEKVGTTQHKIIAYELGKEFPSADMLKKLQTVLNTKLIP